MKSRLFIIALLLFSVMYTEFRISKVIDIIETQNRTAAIQLNTYMKILKLAKVNNDGVHALSCKLLYDPDKLSNECEGE